MAATPFYLLASCLLLISFASCACDRCLHKYCKASYSTSSSAIAAGSCGYGPTAMDFNGGYIAAATHAIYRDGVGCGACFQMRCKNSKLCGSGGVRVVMTDLNKKNNHTDFVLSSMAFNAMARPGMALQLKKLGTVNIEYKRIPCEYKNHNLTLRVEEDSQNPSNLAINFLYQGGQTDILTVEVAQVGSSNTRYMSRRGYSAVWNMSNAPGGELRFRIAVIGGFEPSWIWTEKALPADRKIGSVYDTGVQITEIAQARCMQTL